MGNSALGKAPGADPFMRQPRSALLPLLCTAVLGMLAPVSGTLALAFGAPARPAAQAAGGCGPTRLIPRRHNLARVAQITLCLINRQRAAHGLGPLRENAALARAADRHSPDMVGRGYFSHATPAGVGPPARIVHSGYRAGRRVCATGENIAAATGSFASPGEIVRMWMQSRGHRANILARSYRDTGIGVADGYPAVHNMHGATYTEDFAARC